VRIAVTGASGDMGRTLVPYLVEQGHWVRSIDRALPKDTWGGSQLQYYVADARHFGELAASFKDCDAVVHLAAIRSPMNHPDPVVYSDNTISNYNALSAAALLGIKRVCLASSINAIGGAFSRSPRYDYLPVDEKHPTYAEDPYSLSKWVGEQQADAFARRYEDMSIASMRFHMLIDNADRARERTPHMGEGAARHLWAYTLLSEAARACLLSLTANFQGHEVFYIVAPNTAMDRPSLELAQERYPNAELREPMEGNKGFFNCSKAEKILGWVHEA
jgi:nucleoside-diphosphate-sugar epimerase